MAGPNLEKLERQYEQARARLQAARARKAAKDRKLDARRKIILGGALIEKASRDPEATKLLISLVAGLARAQDRKAFDGWTPPAPETEGNAARDPGGDVGSGTAARSGPGGDRPHSAGEAGGVRAAAGTTRGTAGQDPQVDATADTGAGPRTEERP